MKSGFTRTLAAILIVMVLLPVLPVAISLELERDTFRSSRTNGKDMETPSGEIKLPLWTRDFTPADGDVPTWALGDWWEYNMTFNNTWPDTGEFLYLAGTVKYTVTGIERFPAADGNDYLAYNVSLLGGARGNAHYNGNDLLVNGDRFLEDSLTSGEMTGYRVFRVSDLAILKERSFMEGFVHLDGVGLKFNLTETMFDLSIVDVFDLPLTPGEQFNFSTQENRSFSLYLSEAGYFLKQHSEIFPFSYEMTTAAKSQVTTPAGDFDVYELSGISLVQDDPSTMNHSYSPEVKSYVMQDLYRITATNDDNHSVLDTTMELLDYNIQNIENTIDTESDIALNGIPVKVNGSFPGHNNEDVVVTFPYTGVEVETTTSGTGEYSAKIVSPPGDDDSPSDQDVGSFGVCAYLKDDMSTLVTKSIIIIESDEEAPVAVVEPDKAVDEDSNVLLDGTGSLDNIGIKNYTWSFNYEDIDRLLYGETAMFLFAIPGKYEINLTVTDHGNNIDLASWILTVNDITAPVPVLEDRIIVDEGTLVLFDGSSCFDPDSGTIANYTWRFEYDGLNVTLYGEYASYKFVIPGNYSISLNITDESGNEDNGAYWLQVNDITPPTAEAGEDVTVPQGTEVNLDADASSDNVKIIKWMWTFLYDGSEQTLYGNTTTFEFSIVGDYEITLTVSDARGLRDTDIMWVNVTDTTKPQADAGSDISIYQGTSVTFDGSGSSDNVDIANYNWTFVYEGTEYDMHGVQVSFLFHVPGEYIIILNITDVTGNWDMDKLILTVMDNTNPIAVAGDDQVVNVDEIVYFNGSGSWDNVEVVNWSWSFIYRNRAVVLYGMETTYVFQSIGVYEVELRIRDDAGLTHSNDLIVVVKEGKKIDVVEGEVNEAEFEDKEGKVIARVKVSGNGTLDFKRITREEVKQMVGSANTGHYDLGIYLDITLDDLDWILIEIPYDESNLPSGVEEDSIKLYFWDEYSGRWKVVEDSHVDTDRNIVWANVTHLTVFAPLVSEAEMEGGDVEDKISERAIFAIIIGLLVILNIVFFSMFIRRGKTKPEKGSELKFKDEKAGGGPVDEDGSEIIEMDIDESFCPECGEEVDEEDELCHNCGFELMDEEVEEEEEEDVESGESSGGEHICPECWEDIGKEDDVCPHCSASVIESVDIDEDEDETEEEEEVETMEDEDADWETDEEEMEAVEEEEDEEEVYGEEEEAGDIEARQEGVEEDSEIEEEEAGDMEGMEEEEDEEEAYGDENEDEEFEEEDGEGEVGEDEEIPENVEEGVKGEMDAVEEDEVGELGTEEEGYDEDEDEGEGGEEGGNEEVETEIGDEEGEEEMEEEIDDNVFAAELADLKKEVESINGEDVSDMEDELEGGNGEEDVASDSEEEGGDEVNEDEVDEDEVDEDEVDEDEVDEDGVDDDSDEYDFEMEFEPYEEPGEDE